MRRFNHETYNDLLGRAARKLYGNKIAYVSNTDLPDPDLVWMRGYAEITETEDGKIVRLPITPEFKLELTQAYGVDEAVWLND